MVLLDLPELITITEDQVHMLVESLKGADEDPAVLQDAPHPIVDVLQHLAALSHSLEGVRIVTSLSAATFHPPPRADMLHLHLHPVPLWKTKGPCNIFKDSFHFSRTDFHPFGISFLLGIHIKCSG